MKIRVRIYELGKFRVWDLGFRALRVKSSEF